MRCRGIPLHEASSMRDCALGQQSRQHATGSLFWSEKPMYGSISYPSNIYLSQHLS